MAPPKFITISMPVPLDSYYRLDIMLRSLHISFHLKPTTTYEVHLESPISKMRAKKAKRLKNLPVPYR